MKLIIRKQNLYTLNTKQDYGFTLLELLIVVVIMGIMSALALPSFLQQIGKSRTTEAASTLGIINRTQQAHRLEFGTFGELGDYYLNGNPALSGKIGLDMATLTDADGDNAPDNQLAVSLQPEYYQFTDGRDASSLSELTSTPLGIVNANIAEAFAVSIPLYDNDILDYASQVSQDPNRSFSTIICAEDRLNASDNGSSGPAGNGTTTALATACNFGTQVN